MTNCNCTNNCTVFSVIAGVILGVVTTVLTITATITVTPAFLWVLFGIAVLYLLATLIASPYIRRSSGQQCLCDSIRTLLLGILGTVLTAVVLLGITFAATSITGAIITGLLIFFFSLIITASACLISCISGCRGITG